MVKFVRDSMLVWSYCSDCGCRLNILPMADEMKSVLVHFGLHPNRDSRGCACSKINQSVIVKREKVEQFIKFLPTMR